MAVVLLKEAGYVVPMAVLKPLSGISVGKRAETPLSTARDLLTIRFLDFCLSHHLGSIYSPSCFIDVENEVFEFNGQQIIFDNGVNQLTAKAPGAI
jgi:hypothetical protein